ncbi:hypothetical protein [Muriicola marianensis]|uniref:Uncharacterized protein n=1 Tax=Muriicola marianensis TaxID=1324801 RepID=A0ABQ1R1S2_9FLAO|nr:hypothetical protein [Muriicola marianensis]GGD55171.1 hypothetical protein GCM10011361_22120 [Muriicola marianensis]
MKKVAGLLVILAFCSLQAQQAGVGAPQVAAVENDPFANYHQRWNPMMEKLFQLVRDDDGIVRHFVGAEVGTPYESESFEKGQVWYKDENLGEFYYRYNIFSREIELKRTLLPEEKHQALIRDPKVALILPNRNKEYRYLSFITDKGSKNDDYLVRVYKGSSYTLFKHQESKFTEAKPAANSMVGPTPSKFSNFTSYFLRFRDEPIREISQKKNKFLKEIDDRWSSDLKAYLKEENIDLSDETMLIKAVSYLDTLAEN